MIPDPRSAALYVCSKAVCSNPGHGTADDPCKVWPQNGACLGAVDDAAMLLDALGLVADGALTWPTVPAGLEPRNPRNIAATTGPGARK